MSNIPMPEPAAWMTHHDEPMIFLSASECAHYCDEGEVPIPLIIGLQAECYAAAKVREALEEASQRCVDLDNDENGSDSSEYRGAARFCAERIRALIPKE